MEDWIKETKDKFFAELKTKGYDTKKELFERMGIKPKEEK
jgi:hypothetical protein